MISTRDSRDNGTGRHYSGRQAEDVSTDSTLPPMALDWSEIGEREHFVQFYESDAFLVSSVADYIGAGLQDQGTANVVIATPAHRQACERLWETRGIDVAEARACGRYIALDAVDALDRFMRQRWPQPALFEEVLGHRIAEACARHGRVRAFGEMVALLWAQGNETAAIRLEELWHQLGERQQFALFCAYPLHSFADSAHQKRFRQICRHHQRVIPAESYTALARPGDRLCAISELQQKAAALDALVRERDALVRERDALAARLARSVPLPEPS